MLYIYTRSHITIYKHTLNHQGASRLVTRTAQPEAARCPPPPKVWAIWATSAAEACLKREPGEPGEVERNGGKMVEKWWKNGGKMVGKLENDRKMMEK